ncbi:MULTISPECIES: type II toxin-antitoxin system ParD family antitoxin [Thalassospira]|uniref:Addiction module antitoxin n=1 Tax=Thalassospira profundimaris TaxID=502049 RepID=A0A367VF43_9PROT|nr:MULTISPECIES: type II toxin-antitoxin system ParD family antitoxin [Thalassospira]KZB70262.1 addiction module antitoxin [Thalassospira sp. MCCC 1A01148]RCK23052.1 addiction module antitoxin [Thalassospira profundimaris]
MIKKSITVTETQEAWIQTQLATGQYASDSEIVREALREKQQRMAEIERIRGALIEAEESGLSNVTKEDIRSAVKAEIA